jgi:uncharacterized protein YyaL (SSP411 family)
MKAQECDMTKYPENKLDGLRDLTDETGIIQHTKFSIIDRRHGYTTDDNARALIAALRHHEIFNSDESLRYARLYLTFLLHMYRDDGSYHNFLGYNREYQDQIGTADSMGRCLWALGETINSESTQEMKSAAKWLFDNSLPFTRIFDSPRAKAFTLMGLVKYQQAHQDDENIGQDIQLFANQLIQQYKVESTQEWKWFESYLTYSNPRIPHSLAKAYNVTKDEEYLRVSRESLDFLIGVQFMDSVFHPVGSEGWYQKGGTKSEYDQQPIEASCMVEASIELAKITEDQKYVEAALDAFQWYHGKNSENISLVNLNNFTCYDGLTRNGLNLNQGAESTISYYLAYLKLKGENLI